jgi:hypothetical protein
VRKKFQAPPTKHQRNNKAQIPNRGRGFLTADDAEHAEGERTETEKKMVRFGSGSVGWEEAER